MEFRSGGSWRCEKTPDVGRKPEDGRAAVGGIGPNVFKDPVAVVRRVRKDVHLGVFPICVINAPPPRSELAVMETKSTRTNDPY